MLCRELSRLAALMRGDVGGGGGGSVNRADSRLRRPFSSYSYIKYKHNQQMKEILWVGLALTIVVEIILVAIPEQRKR